MTNLLQSTSREQYRTTEREHTQQSSGRRRGANRDLQRQPCHHSRRTALAPFHQLHHLHAAVEAVWSGDSVAASGMLARLYQRRSVHLLAALPPVPQPRLLSRPEPEVNGYGCGDLTGGRRLGPRPRVLGRHSWRRPRPPWPLGGARQARRLRAGKPSARRSRAGAQIHCLLPETDLDGA